MLIIWVGIDKIPPWQLQRSAFNVKFRIIVANIANHDINRLVSAADSELRCLVEFAYYVVHLLSVTVRRTFKCSFY